MTGSISFPNFINFQILLRNEQQSGFHNAPVLYRMVYLNFSYATGRFQNYFFYNSLEKFNLVVSENQAWKIEL